MEAIQALGGNGYTNEYPVGRMMRDAKLYEIGAGTNEIRRWLIGRELVKTQIPKYKKWDNNLIYNFFNLIKKFN